MLTHGLALVVPHASADAAPAGAHSAFCVGGAGQPCGPGDRRQSAYRRADLHHRSPGHDAGREREARLEGEIEVDESYFGGIRKQLRGRAVQGKAVILGLLKRRGRVYTRPVPNVTRTVLQRIIRQKVPRGSTIYSDGFRSYDGLLTDGYRHHRILHEQTFAHSRRRHINGIENFWGFAKTKLRRYYGVRRSHFVLYLKEMEFRFNHRHEDLPLLIERILKQARRKLD
jgi:transposase-like protein